MLSVEMSGSLFLRLTFALGWVINTLIRVTEKGDYFISKLVFFIFADCIEVHSGESVRKMKTSETVNQNLCACIDETGHRDPATDRSVVRTLLESH